MFRFSALVLMLALASSTRPPVSAQASVEQKATAIAETWLALVDEGRFEESWTSAAASFKAAVPQEKWVAAVAGARRPFGKVLSRTLASAEFRTSLPGAPDGSYVVVQFATAFEHKASASERIVPMLEPDGSWRIAGYFVQ